MIQILPLKILTISYNWEFDFFQNYIRFLLTRKNYYTNRNFEKQSNLPKNKIYLETYIRNYYPFDNLTNIIKIYDSVTTLNLSINSFYNLITYLKQNELYSFTLSDLLNYLDVCKFNSNELLEKPKNKATNLLFL